MVDNILKVFIKEIQEAKNILVLTGSGISAECGLPTFRGENGLWDEKIVSQVATLEGLNKDPIRAWEWYNKRISESQNIEPGPGHRALKKLSKIKNLTVATQNIDGLHTRAGTPALEIHGSLRTIICTDCLHQETLIETLPKERIFHSCGGILRPKIVFFQENLPEDAWFAAQKAAFEADILLAIGTSGIVYPAVTLLTPRRPRVSVYSIDPQNTALPPWVKPIKMTAGAALEALLETLTTRHKIIAL